MNAIAVVAAFFFVCGSVFTLLMVEVAMHFANKQRKSKNKSSIS